MQELWFLCFAPRLKERTQYCDGQKDRGTDDHGKNNVCPNPKVGRHDFVIWMMRTNLWRTNFCNLKAVFSVFRSWDINLCNLIYFQMCADESAFAILLSEGAAFSVLRPTKSAFQPCDLKNQPLHSCDEDKHFQCVTFAIL